MYEQYLGNPSFFVPTFGSYEQIVYIFGEMQKIVEEKDSRILDFKPKTT